MTMHHQVLHPSSLLSSAFAGAGPCDCEEGPRCGSVPVLLAEAESSQPATSPPRDFLQRKGKVRKGVWSWRTLSRVCFTWDLTHRGQIQAGASGLRDPELGFTDLCRQKPEPGHLKLGISQSSLSLTGCTVDAAYGMRLVAGPLLQKFEAMCVESNSTVWHIRAVKVECTCQRTPWADKRQGYAWDLY